MGTILIWLVIWFAASLIASLAIGAWISAGSVEVIDNEIDLTD